MALIMPQEAYRFRVYFPEAPESKFLHITQQVEDVTIDLLNKKVNLVVRQSVEKELLQAINYIVDRKVSPEIEFMDQNDDVNFAVAFYFAKLTSHEMKVSYTADNVLKHKLEWTFDSMRVLERSNLMAPAEIKESDPSFPTPEAAIAELRKKQDDTPKPSV